MYNELILESFGPIVNAFSLLCLPPLWLTRSTRLRRIARVSLSRLLLGRVSLSLRRIALRWLLWRIALGGLLRVTRSRVALLWGLVVLLLGVPLCLGRLLISIWVVAHWHGCVRLIGHGHSRLGGIGQGPWSSCIGVWSSCSCRWCC